MLGISMEHRRTMVTKPACELIRERWSTDVAPEMWARAAARASTAPFSSISFSADCLKWPMAVGGTESKSLCENETSVSVTTGKPQEGRQHAGAAAGATLV